ncbi:MAG: hypothetical protein EU548_04925 [Promethearchaeota archaeon]|nr:MAG: hypothetical protein EU548_04925 [Candidatus Lokiarchaeota archaeon]
MGAVQWLLKKITKAFGRSTNSLFYTLLYREILKEVNEISKNEEDSILILREIGKRAARESCERHSSVFKFMPGSPEKVLDYFELLWVVVFGKEIAEGDLTYEEIPNDGSKYNDYIIRIKTCPICAGYGSDSADTFDFQTIKNENVEGLACGLTGMLESVANFILKVKRNDYRIKIVEQRCMARGEECLQFKCKIFDAIEWKKLSEIKIKDKLKSNVKFEESLEDEVLQETKVDIIDTFQDFLSLDKIEEMLDEPLEGIKSKVRELIQDKLNMEPEHFFDYFKNYEEDMIRIIGFLAIHLLNEYGGLVEKILANETFSKVVGYFFQQLKEFSLLFIPIDVINDYHQLLISFLEGLAPVEMVENVRQFTGKDDLNYLFEGAQLALENLGINFTELKENVWEELRRERENGLVSSEQSVMEKTEENFPKIIRIIQELFMLMSEILTLPIRVIISESHYGLKTAVNSVVSEDEGLFGTIKGRVDTIFDYIQEIRP